MPSLWDTSLCIIGICYLSYLMRILANGARATGIKAAVAETQNGETVFEDEKEDEPAEDVNDKQENSDRDNSPIEWPDSLPASPRAAINDSSLINTPSKHGHLDSQLEQEISFSTQDVPLSTQATANQGKKSTQHTFEQQTR